MNEFSTYEFAVRQRKEGKWRFARIALIALYIGFPIAILIFGAVNKVLLPLLALTPLATWMLVFATWRFVDIEYEYSITSGELTFAKIFGGRSRRTYLHLTLRDAVRIAPLENEAEAAKATAYRPEKEFSCISSLLAPDIYFILFEHEYTEGGKTKKCRAIFYFEATAKALQICRYYNPSATVITPTQR